MLALLLLLLLSPAQDAPSVTVGKTEIPVRVRAAEGERGPSTLDFGPIERGRGILVAYPRDRHLHFHRWTRGADAGSRKYDVAFIGPDGEVREVVALDAEYLPDPRPPYGINKIRGITSEQEVRYALFLPPRQAARLGVQRGARAEIDLAGAPVEAMPALSLGDRTIHLELLATEPDRSRGLTYRTKFSRGDGLLFAWADAKLRPIWMYHTLLPIDLTYLDAAGTILEIHPTPRLKDPDSEDEARAKLTPTRVEAPYILETPYGYMAEAGFKVGDRFELPQALEKITPDPSPFE